MTASRSSPRSGAWYAWVHVRVCASDGISRYEQSPRGSSMSKRGCSGRCTPPVVTSARRHSERGFSGRTKGATVLDVETDEHDVPVFDDVVAAFEAYLRLLAGPRPGAGGHDVLPTSHLRCDEAALHVGVDPAGRPPRRRALPHRPRPALLLVEGEERDEAEQTMRRPDELLEARRSEEHTSELQSRQYLVCRLLLEKKKNNMNLFTSSLSNPIHQQLIYNGTNS